MKKFFDLGSLALSNSGGVHGTEAALEALAEYEIEEVSGSYFSDEYAESTNDGCSNGGDCSSASNTGCTNVYRSKCLGGSNDGCKTQQA